MYQMCTVVPHARRLTLCQYGAPAVNRPPGFRRALVEQTPELISLPARTIFHIEIFKFDFRGPGE